MVYFIAPEGCQDTSFFQEMVISADQKLRNSD